MKKLTKLLMVFAAVIGFGTATVAANPIEYNNNLGLYTMYATSGTFLGGLQYQHWFTDKLGATFEGAAYCDNSTYVTTPFWINLNAEVDYKLYESSIGNKTGTRLYAWGKLGHYGSVVPKTRDQASNTITSYGYEPNLIFGTGFCVEMIFLDHISIPVEFGFLGQAPYDVGFGFCFGTGVRYTF